MQRNLKDKVVWITGASGGMGQHIALTLSKLQCKIILSEEFWPNLSLLLYVGIPIFAKIICDLEEMIFIKKF